jgi:hypothetical protein
MDRPCRRGRRCAALLLRLTYINLPQCAPQVCQVMSALRTKLGHRVVMVLFGCIPLNCEEVW